MLQSITTSRRAIAVGDKPQYVKTTVTERKNSNEVTTIQETLTVPKTVIEKMVPWASKQIGLFEAWPSIHNTFVRKDLRNPNPIVEQIITMCGKHWANWIQGEIPDIHKINIACRDFNNNHTLYWYEVEYSADPNQKCSLAEATPHLRTLGLEVLEKKEDEFHRYMVNINGLTCRPVIVTPKHQIWQCDNEYW